jgi:hypothetical protein
MTSGRPNHHVGVPGVRDLQEVGHTLFIGRDFTISELT